MPRRRIALTSTWRAPGLPGVTAPIPPGGCGLAIGPRMARQYTQLLRSYDNAATIRKLAPYAASADAVCEAVVVELESLGYPVGPSVLVLIEALGFLRMWARFLSEEAERKIDAASDEQSAVDPKLIGLSMTAMEGAKSNLLAAHALHAQAIAAQRSVLQADDPLAGFRDEPTVAPPPAEPKPDEPA